MTMLELGDRSRSAGSAALLILLAYLLLSAGKLTGQSPRYQGMNVVGAAGFIINSAGGTAPCRRPRSMSSGC